MELDLTEEDLTILIYLVRNRLRYEAQRKPKVENGHDVQVDRVWALQNIKEKLERIKLAL